MSLSKYSSEKLIASLMSEIETTREGRFRRACQRVVATNWRLTSHRTVFSIFGRLSSFYDNFRDAALTIFVVALGSGVVLLINFAEARHVDVGVDLRRRDAFVTEHFLDLAEVGAVLEHVGRE